MVAQNNQRAPGRGGGAACNSFEEIITLLRRQDPRPGEEDRRSTWPGNPLWRVLGKDLPLHQGRAASRTVAAASPAELPGSEPCPARPSPSWPAWPRSPEVAAKAEKASAPFAEAEEGRADPSSSWSPASIALATIKDFAKEVHQRLIAAEVEAQDGRAPPWPSSWSGSTPKPATLAKPWQLPLDTPDSRSPHPCMRFFLSSADHGSSRDGGYRARRRGADGSEGRIGRGVRAATLYSVGLLWWTLTMKAVIGVVGEARGSSGPISLPRRRRPLVGCGRRRLPDVIPAPPYEAGAPRPRGL